MKRYAFMRDGVAVNVAVGKPTPQWVECPDDVSVGWTFDGAEWARPSPFPEPVPESISRHQVAMQLLADGLITGPEAVAMSTTSAPPAMIEATFAAMTEPDQTFARIRFASDRYRRDDVLLNAVMAATGATQADIDQFFRNAATR